MAGRYAVEDALHVEATLPIGRQPRLPDWIAGGMCVQQLGRRSDRKEEATV